VLIFVGVKALSTGLSGARSLVLAAILGPTSYGAFGTLIIIQQYLSYFALGAREGVAIRLARAHDSPGEVKVIYSSALAWGVCAGLAILGTILGLYFAGQIESHVLWVGLISLCSVLNEILVNINRHEHKLRKVAFIEVSYNAIVLIAVLCLWKRATVSLALQAVLLGTLFSATVYLTTLRGVSWSAIRWPTMRGLIAIGLLPALLSATILVLNSFYVIAANWMKLGPTTGLVVLANNISMMILFGLNTVSWALASRSMARHFAVAAGDDATATEVTFSDIIFRLGIGGAVLLAIVSHWLIEILLPQYSGAGIFVLYFCLFQCYGLLLFSETNFLNVNAKTPVIVAGYLMLGGVLTALCFSGIAIETLVRLGVLAYFLLALGIALHSRGLGFHGGSSRQRFATLAFPASCALAELLGGYVAVAAVAIAFIAITAFTHRMRICAVLEARRMGST
jgi:hypothetical protein